MISQVCSPNQNQKLGLELWNSILYHNCNTLSFKHDGRLKICRGIIPVCVYDMVHQPLFNNSHRYVSIKMMITVDLNMFLEQYFTDKLLCRLLINNHRSLRCFLVTRFDFNGPNAIVWFSLWCQTFSALTHHLS